jgi:sugar phosphate permease
MVFGTALLMSTFSVINNWFRSWRGTALGIVTLVSPLGNATSVSFLGHGTATIGFTPTFMLMSCIVAALGIVGLFIVRETPEQIGLYPDGALVAPPPEILQNDALVDKIGFKHIFRYKEAWLHCLIFGICAFGLTVYPGFFVPRFTELGFSPGQITAFTYGFSLFGGGLSFLSGLIDDKLGTRTATMMVMALFFFGTIGLRFGTPDHPWMIWVGIVSLGGIVGAYPNLNPSLVAYTYGRKCFSHVFRFINTGVYILPSFGFYFATRLYEVHGSYNLPYTLMIPISLLGLLCVFLANKKHDLTIDIEKEIQAKATK